MLKDPLCPSCQRPTLAGFYEHLRQAPLAAMKAVEGPCPRCRRVAERRSSPPAPQHAWRALLAGLLRP